MNSLENPKKDGLSDLRLSIPYHVKREDLGDFFSAFADLQKNHPVLMTSLKKLITDYQAEKKNKKGMERAIHQIAFGLAIMAIMISSFIPFIGTNEQSHFFYSLIKDRKKIYRLLKSARSLKKAMGPALKEIKDITKKIKKSPVESLRELGDLYLLHRKESLALSIFSIDLIQAAPEELFSIFIEDVKNPLIKKHGLAAINMIKALNPNQCYSFIDAFLTKCSTLEPDSKITDIVPIFLQSLEQVTLDPTKGISTLCLMLESEFYQLSIESIDDYEKDHAFIDSTLTSLEKDAFSEEHTEAILSSELTGHSTNQFVSDQTDTTLNNKSFFDTELLKDKMEFTSPAIKKSPAKILLKEIFRDLKEPFLDYFFQNPAAFSDLQEAFIKLDTAEKGLLFLQLQSAYQAIVKRDRKALMISLRDIPSDMRHAVIQTIVTASRDMISDLNHNPNDSLTNEKKALDNGLLKQGERIAVSNPSPLISKDTSAFALLELLSKAPVEHFHTITEVIITTLTETAEEEKISNKEILLQISEKLHVSWSDQDDVESILGSFFTEGLKLIQPTTDEKGLIHRPIPIEILSGNPIVQNELIFLQSKLQPNDVIAAVVTIDSIIADKPEKAIQRLQSMPLDIRQSILKIAIEHLKNKKTKKSMDNGDENSFVSFLRNMDDSDLELFTKLIDKIPAIPREEGEKVSHYIKNMFAEAILVLDSKDYQALRGFIIKQIDPISRMMADSFDTKRANSEDNDLYYKKKSLLSQNLKSVFESILKNEDSIGQKELSDLLKKPSRKSFFQVLKMHPQLKKSREIMDQMKKLGLENADELIEAIANKLIHLPLAENWHSKSKELGFFYDHAAQTMNKEQLREKIIAELLAWKTYLNAEKLEKFILRLSDTKTKIDLVRSVMSILRDIPEYHKSTIFNIILQSHSLSKVPDLLKSPNAAAVVVSTVHTTLKGASLFKGVSKKLKKSLYLKKTEPEPKENVAKVSHILK